MAGFNRAQPFLSATNEQPESNDQPKQMCEQCGAEFDGNPRDSLGPDCREQSDQEVEGDDTDLGLCIL